MRIFPLINRAFYEVAYDKLALFQYTTESDRLQRHEDIKEIMEINVKHRKVINEIKLMHLITAK